MLYGSEDKLTVMAELLAVLLVVQHQTFISIFNFPKHSQRFIPCEDAGMSMPQRLSRMSRVLLFCCGAVEYQALWS